MANLSVPQISGIYIIRNLKNGKFYIGQSQNIRERWAGHKRALNKKTHRNKHLQAAWNKYGANVFKFLVLEYCTIDKLDEREQIQLDHHAQTDSCYNIALDAKANMRGRKFSDEVRRKMGDIQRGKKKPPFSEEHHKHLSESATGRKHTDLTRQKLSISHSGKKRTPLSAETRRKISETNKGQSRSEEFKLKMREALKGNTNRKGTPTSEASRRKMSESAKLRQARERAKKIE